MIDTTFELMAILYEVYCKNKKEILCEEFFRLFKNSKQIDGICLIPLTLVNPKVALDGCAIIKIDESADLFILPILCKEENKFTVPTNYIEHLKYYKKDKE